MRRFIMLGLGAGLVAIGAGCDDFGDGGGPWGTGGAGGESALCPASDLGNGSPAAAQSFGMGGTPECVIGTTGGVVLSSVAVDAQGNAVVVGNALGDATIGATPLPGHGLIAAAVDPSCKVLWATRLGGHDDVQADAVAVDPSGGFVVTGKFTGTVDFGAGPLVSANDDALFLASFDASQTLRWAQSFAAQPAGMSSAEGIAVAVDGTGHVLLSATAEGTLDLGGGALDDSNGALLAAFDGKGNALWSRALQLGGQGTVPIAVDAAGDVHVGVAAVGAFDLGGGPTQIPAGAGIVSATLDPDGKVLGSTVFALGQCSSPSPCLFGVGAVAASADGHTALGGLFAGTLDAGGFSVQGVESQEMNVLSALDPAGKTQWAHAAGMVVDTNLPVGTAVDAAGDVVAGGNFWCSVDLGGGALQSLAGSNDAAFVAKLGPDGSHRYSRAFGGAADVIGVAATSAGEAIVIGQFQGTLDLGGMTLAQGGSAMSESYVARFAP